MSPTDLFKVVTSFGNYLVGYIVDGWTKEISIRARSPGEAMVIVQNIIGDICNVTYVERG